MNQPSTLTSSLYNDIGNDIELLDNPIYNMRTIAPNKPKLMSHLHQKFDRKDFSIESKDLSSIELKSDLLQSDSCIGSIGLINKPSPCLTYSILGISKLTDYVKNDLMKKIPGGSKKNYLQNQSSKFSPSTRFKIYNSTQLSSNLRPKVPEMSPQCKPAFNCDSESVYPTKIEIGNLSSQNSDKRVMIKDSLRITLPNSNRSRRGNEFKLNVLKKTSKRHTLVEKNEFDDIFEEDSLMNQFIKYSTRLSHKQSNI